jgi:hypothetical protein
MALVFLALAPVFALAQGSIAGVVRDTSGAVLPGVTVEASSPVLIEKVRSVASDGSGQYLIVNLPPGAYTVTFTLSGFNTLKREGIVLTGNFTATVNADLRVGALEETITVSGEAPTVDVQSAARQQVIDREVIENVPGGRNIWALGALSPALSTNTGQDVGGATINATTGLMAHGGRNNDGWTSMAGITMNAMASQGWTTRLIYNMASLQEVTLDYSANTAEVPTGGVRINIIPREGGNTFNGTFFGSIATGAMQSNNVTDDLRQRGLRTPDAVKKLWDVNPGFGGPLRRDKVWFYVSGLYTGSLLDVANMWFNKNANNPNAWTYEPDLSRPAFKDTHYQGGDFRLTWQISPRNKLGVLIADQNGCTCVGVVSSTIAPEADIKERFPIQRRQLLDWTSPVTSRLLLEAGFAKHYGRSIRVPGPDTSPQMITVNEQSTGLRYRAADNFRNGPNESWNYRFVTSYVTGAHAYKAGVTHTNGYESRDTNDAGQPLTYRFNNGIPNQLTQRATPYFSRVEVPHNFGLFAQDKWTVRRFTASYGLRFDWFTSRFAEQTLGPTVFTPTRNVTYPETDNLNWKDLSPRLGAIYDLFGNGRTALKASLNKYLQNEAAGSVLNIGPNPLERIAVSTTRAWRDANGNYVPDCNLVSPIANGECGAMANSAFGTVRIGNTYDPELLTGWNSRVNNWEFSAGVQHELMPRTSIDVAYFRRSYGNFAVTDDRALAASDFDTFQFTAPTDARLPNGGGYAIAGLYDLKPAAFGRPADNYVTNAKNFGGQTERWHGLDVNLSMRAQNGFLVQGGLSTGSTLYDTCEIRQDLPEMAPTNPFCRYETAYLTNIKGLASYTLPRIDVLLSGTFRSVPGTNILANYAVTNALIAPSLGRPLSGGTANVTVGLVAPGELYTERYNQLDLRVGKILRFGRTRTTVNLDLYNVFNGNNVLTMNNTFGPAWQRPNSIMLARFAKVSAQFDF